MQMIDFAPRNIFQFSKFLPFPGPAPEIIAMDRIMREIPFSAQYQQQPHDPPKVGDRVYVRRNSRLLLAEILQFEDGGATVRMLEGDHEGKERFTNKWET